MFNRGILNSFAFTALGGDLYFRLFVDELFFIVTFLDERSYLQLLIRFACRILIPF